MSDAASTGNLNPLEAADVSNGGNSATPDLVSATFKPGATSTDADQVVYTFDQGVTTTFVAGDFQVYYVDGSEDSSGSGARINPNNNTQVVVNYTNGTLTDAVGASVLPGAVTATNASGSNQADEVGVAGTSGTTGGQTPGRTAGPDLTGVKITQDPSDIFGAPGAYHVTYTFDQDVAVKTATRSTSTWPMGRRRL